MAHQHPRLPHNSAHLVRRAVGVDRPITLLRQAAHPHRPKLEYETIQPQVSEKQDFPNLPAGKHPAGAGIFLADYLSADVCD